MKKTLIALLILIITLTCSNWVVMAEENVNVVLDGKTITFMTDSSSNSEITRYEEHTYLYFEEFDQKLVEMGIPKESDSTGYENISMDQEYIDRFLRILENH